MKTSPQPITPKPSNPKINAWARKAGFRPQFKASESESKPIAPPPDYEIRAMSTCFHALETLNHEALKRALDWLQDRFQHRIQTK